MSEQRGGDEVLVELEGAVLYVTMNRPEKRNALNAAAIDALDQALARGERDSAVHVIVLRGSGDHFSAGFDLGTVSADELVEERFPREREQLFDRAMALRDLDKPTIASVQGACVAAGLLLSQMCDLIVAERSAYFYNPLPRMGGVALEVLLEPWDIGIRRAKRYLFTAQRIPAPVALELGMITDLAEDGSLAEVTAELAEQVAGMPPVTLSLLKRSLNRTQDLMGMRDSVENHFALHQFAHATQESRELLHAARQGRSLKDYFNKRDGGQL